jgi:DNA primase catalytic core
MVQEANYSVQLQDLLERDILPRLTAEQVFTHESHHWHKDPNKWRGGCPWHKSKSGTSFYVEVDTLLWRCPACQVGGGPLQYRWRLKGHSSVSPRGQVFIDEVRELAALAGIPFPERELNEEEREAARKRDARRLILESVIAYSEIVLWSEQGQAARAYLHERSFTDENIRDLRLGLYLSAASVRKALQSEGHASEDVKATGVVWTKLEGYILFPWCDEYGRALTIYGTWHTRTPPEGTPKKRALPGEGTKGSALYFDRARKAGHTDLVLVEGVTDAALGQAMGDTRVVACVAAELSRLQVETFKRHKVASITICLDPDAAGDNGIRSCVRSLIHAGIKAYVAPKLPDGLDPDEFLQARGMEAWKAHVAQAVHAYRYKARLILREKQPEMGWTDPCRDAAIEEAVEFASALPHNQQDELSRYFWPEILEAVGGNAEAIEERVQKERARKSNGKDTTAATAKSSCQNIDSLWKPFPVNELPRVASEYVCAASQAIGCDPSYIALPLLAGTSAAIGNSRRIVLKRSWSEPAVVWAVTIGPSGTLKSPGAEAAVDPIIARQAKALKEYDDKISAFETDKVIYDAKLSEWKKKGIKGNCSPPDRPQKPIFPRLWCSDITIEAMATRLLESPKGLLLYRDELSGWLRSFDQYRGGRGGDVGHWLSIHGARPLLMDRKNGDKHTLSVPHAFASLAGGIQRRILATTLAREHFDDGLASRLLLAMPPKKRKRWTEFDIEPDQLSKLASLYNQLYTLNLRQDEKTGFMEPVPVGLSPKAKAIWVDFYNCHADEQHQLVEDDLIAAWSKLEGYAARLALIFHCCRVACLEKVDPAEIDEKSMASGIILSRWFCNETRRVYMALAQSTEEGERDALVKLIQGRGGSITVRELMRCCRKYGSDAEVAEQALNDLVHAGLAVCEQKPPGNKGGHPTFVYRLTQSVDS